MFPMFLMMTTIYENKKERKNAENGLGPRLKLFEELEEGAPTTKYLILF